MLTIQIHTSDKKHILPMNIEGKTSIRAFSNCEHSLLNHHYVSRKWAYIAIGSENMNIWTIILTLSRKLFIVRPRVICIFINFTWHCTRLCLKRYYLIYFVDFTLLKKTRMIKEIHINMLRGRNIQSIQNETIVYIAQNRLCSLCYRIHFLSFYCLLILEVMTCMF